MSRPEEFSHLILLIGTNPLPNFVVADYFLQTNPNIRTIWLLHSEENKFQAGTCKQAENLETLLRNRWDGKHKNIHFPLEKISLSDVSDAATINRELQKKIFNRYKNSGSFHLNYTGGTKAMATHTYMLLKHFQKSGQSTFSYLDANNFRLVVDGKGIVVYDLRKEVHVAFNDLISLNGFNVKNKKSIIDEKEAIVAHNKFMDLQNDERMNGSDGNNFEKYVFLKLETLKYFKLNNSDMQHNLHIKIPDWSTYFELDLIMINGYHLTGISCTVSSDKKQCKLKGFEIILRVKQIGGDEARAILITRLDKDQTRTIQEELAYETGNKDNILVLGVKDLCKEDIYLNKIEEFVFS